MSSLFDLIFCIVNWENGVTEIRARDLIRLSELYEIPIEYLEVP